MTIYRNGLRYIIVKLTYCILVFIGNNNSRPATPSDYKKNMGGSASPPQDPAPPAVPVNLPPFVKLRQKLASSPSSSVDQQRRHTLTEMTVDNVVVSAIFYVICFWQRVAESLDISNTCPKFSSLNRSLC